MNKKEGLLVEINPNIPQPYKDYIRMRNGQIGQDIATICDLPFQGFVPIDEPLPPNHYIVVSKSIDLKTARNLGIDSPADFYGLAVDSLPQVGKSILHRTTSLKTPPFYNPNFADKVKDAVLPGFACFTKDDALKTYQQFGHNGFDLRLKSPSESDGNGQYRIENIEHIEQLLSNEDETISKEGIILEANLHQPKTISVGSATFGDQTISFLAHQKNDSPDQFGQSKYLGAKDITVVKGPLPELFNLPDLSGEEHLALKKAAKFDAVYRQILNPLASRLSYDVVLGLDNHDKLLAGVTDITGRVGGTCPGLMIACLAMNNDPSIQTVFAEVTLNYDPAISLPEEQNSTLYIDHPSLRLSAKIHQTTNR